MFIKCISDLDPGRCRTESQNSTHQIIKHIKTQINVTLTIISADAKDEVSNVKEKPLKSHKNPTDTLGYHPNILLNRKI